MENVRLTLEHPPSGLKATFHGKVLADLVTTGKALVSLAIKTAPIWLPLVVSLASPPPPPTSAT